MILCMCRRIPHDLAATQKPSHKVLIMDLMQHRKTCLQIRAPRSLTSTSICLLPSSPSPSVQSLVAFPCPHTHSHSYSHHLHPHSHPDILLCATLSLLVNEHCDVEFNRINGKAAAVFSNLFNRYPSSFLSSTSYSEKQ